ncbi:uncharacterized protein [Rutidosis leptorrhynchoides]|uniref:uncharacterized protein n=1 Tax=Rutidosis leptorrhynchoides TaxID=125765 RepID=UPI003A99B0DD
MGRKSFNSNLSVSFRLSSFFMKILSLNVRGFAAKGKFGWVRSICLKERPCVAVFQETKCKEVSDIWVQSLWGDLNCGYVQKGAVEIPISERKFTRISDDGVKFSKLDRFLVSDGFLHLWDDLLIISLDRNLSDHCPLILRDRVLDYGPRPFKVFNEWFNCVEVGNVIKEAWEQPILGSRKDCAFRDKLKNVKVALKTWSHKNFGSLDTEINDLKKEAMEWELKAKSNILSDSDRATWLDCRRRWVEKEKVKTNMMKQKAKVKWILDGDENSKFFHATLRRKYNNCNFRGIMVDGAWHKDSVFVKDTIYNHFQKQFSKNLECRPRILGGFISCSSSVQEQIIGSTVARGPIRLGVPGVSGNLDQYACASGIRCKHITVEEANGLE